MSVGSSAWIDSLSGMISGMICKFSYMNCHRSRLIFTEIVSSAIVAGHPLDSIKSRMQLARNKHSTLQVVTHAVRAGPTTLFRGLTPPLLAAGAVNAVCFGAYR